MRRNARAREGREDQMPARGEAGRLTAPERGVRRQRHELAQMSPKRVDDAHGAVGVVDADMHVQPVDELAAPRVLQLVDQHPVAVAVHDALALEQAERVCARRAEPQAVRLGGHDRVAPDRAQFAAPPAGCPRRRRCGTPRATRRAPARRWRRTPRRPRRPGWSRPAARGRTSAGRAACTPPRLRP